MNGMNVNSGRQRVVKQFINKNIIEEVVTGPGQQFGYPINVQGKLKKLVNTGNGKGSFSHNLTVRQINSVIRNGKPITYKRVVKTSVLNPKWAAAEHRREVNNLSSLLNSTSMANGGRYKTKHGKSHKKSKARKTSKTHKRN
jgi:hypothetical protein